MSPSKAADRLKSNPVFQAALACDDYAAKPGVEINKDFVNNILLEIVEHAMEEGPILMWDEEKQKHVQVGYRELDSKNARETAKLLGLDIGMFQKTLNLATRTPLEFNHKLPESLQRMMDDEYKDQA